MNNEIILKCRKDGKFFRKEIKREMLMATFEGLIKGFSPNNMVSKQLAEIIPSVKELRINWDSTAEINQLYYISKNKIGGIPIIHTHSVVWAVLDGYCRDGEEISINDF